MFQRIPV